MSLIADALKAAQGDRAAARAGGGRLHQRAVAASVLQRGDGGSRGFAAASNRMPKSLGFATAVFGCAIMIAVGVVAVAPHDIAEPLDGRPSEGGTAASRSVVATPTPRQRIAAIPIPAVDAEVAGPGTGPALAAEPTLEGGSSSAPPPVERPLARRVPVDQNATAGSSPTVGGTRSAPDDPPRTEEKRSAVAAPREGTTAAEPGRFQLTVDPPRAASRDLVSEAVSAHRRNDFATAIQLYQQALEQNPRNAPALVNLGTSYQAAGQHGRARDAFRRALDLNPRDARAWSNLGAALGALGEAAEAQAALGEAIRLDPGNHGAKVNLANHYLARGITADARHLFEEVVRDQPGHAEAQYGLGRALEALGERQGAAAHYRKFLESASGRFPQLETAVRQRIEQLSAAPRR